MGKEQEEALIKEALKDIHHFLKIQLCTLHFSWHDYKALFGHSKERVDLINTCAGNFFHKVQLTMLQHLELSIVRLLDPAKQGKNKNLTFPRLVDMSKAVLEGGQAQSLKCKLEYARKCSKRLKDRRHKVIAHLDTQVIQDKDQAILEWPRIEEIEDSLKALAELANTYEQLMNLPIVAYDFRDSIGGSENLVNHLKNSLRLRELVNQGVLTSELAYPDRAWPSKNTQTPR